MRDQVFASYQAGEYADALALALESPERFPEHRAEATFWAACMYSVQGEPGPAVQVLHKALDEGMWWAPALLRDPDLDEARLTADFAALSAESERRWVDACSDVQPTVRLHAATEASGPLLIVLHGRTADQEDMEPLWVGAVDAGVTVAYLRSSQLVTSDRMWFHWVDADRTSKDIQHGIRVARERLGFDPDPILLGAFSAGGRFGLELAFGQELANVRAAITVGAALPPDPRDFPLSQDLGAHGVRAWLIVGAEDRFRPANEALHTLLRERGTPCRLTVVPNLGHDLPRDLPERLRAAIPFVLARSG